MHTRRPVLETPRVDVPALQIDLIPPERAQLAAAFGLSDRSAASIFLEPRF
jgi:hypothetical protein